MALNRKLRMGMVGGGRGAFIGAVHRMAANLDGKIELVAGAFSSDPEKSKLSGEDFFLDPDDEAGSTLQKDDELWVRIEIPAFIEPILARGVLLDISGTSGSGKGTRVSLEFRDIDPIVRRKLTRAAENLGAMA